MAGSKTAYLSKAILDHMLGGATFTQPATLYVALSTVAFSSAATGASFSEVAASGYARISIANNSTTWGAASAAAPSTKSNLIEIDFAQAAASWGTPLSAYLADAATAGNLLFGADITNPQAIAVGDTVKIAIGAFVFSED